MRNLPQLAVPECKLVPVALATKLRGHIIVNGKDSDPPQNDWIPLKLTYSIKEDFVGWMVTTDYYDPAAKQFTDKRDYFLSYMISR